jgi:hypothetical protein
MYYLCTNSLKLSGNSINICKKYEHLHLSNTTYSRHAVLVDGVSRDKGSSYPALDRT